jgi:hypothetical protein
MTEHEQFDVWFDKEYPISGDCGRIKYRESSVRDLMVAAWQASRLAALEEAAERIEPRNASEDWTEYASIRAEAAAAIRALAKETNNG